jgi:hypothetical protein
MSLTPKQKNARNRNADRMQYLPAVASLCLSLQGCAPHGAPSYEVFGAYFPLWLLSALLGLVGALVAHRISVLTGWAQIVPFQLFVCAAIGLMVAVVIWLSMTGQLP